MDNVLLDLSPLALSIIAGSAIFFVMVLMAVFLTSSDDSRQKRMSIIAGRHGLSGAASSGELNDRDKRRTEIAKKLKETSADEKKKQENNKQTIRDLMIYAGWEAPVSHFWIMSGICSALFLGISLLMGASPLVMILSAVTGFFGAPRFILKTKAAKRQKKFLEEFADALESMVRLLKAGMPIGEAIAMVAREFKGPLGDEMGRVYENQKIGVPLGEAVLETARRVPLAEVRMFATGIMIQQQTGSSLSDVLLNLSALIRARFRLRRKVQALSAEAKASAMIIGMLPVVVATGLYFLNPTYIGLLFITSSGKTYLMGAIIWMAIGALVMKQMINFKV